MMLYVCSQNEDLYTACDNGDVSEVKKLLSRGGDVNYRTTRQFKVSFQLCVMTHVVTGV